MLDILKVSRFLLSFSLNRRACEIMKSHIIQFSWWGGGGRRGGGTPYMKVQPFSKPIKHINTSIYLTIRGKQDLYIQVIDLSSHAMFFFFSNI